MTRVAWSIAGVLVAGRVVGDVFGDFSDLEPRRVVAVIFLALLLSAAVARFILNGRGP